MAIKAMIRPEKGRQKFFIPNNLDRSAFFSIVFGMIWTVLCIRNNRLRTSLVMTSDSPSEIVINSMSSSVSVCNFRSAFHRCSIAADNRATWLLVLLSGSFCLYEAYEFLGDVLLLPKEGELFFKLELQYVENLVGFIDSLLGPVFSNWPLLLNDMFCVVICCVEGFVFAWTRTSFLFDFVAL